MNTEKTMEVTTGKAAETTAKEWAEESVVITDPQLAVPDVTLNDLTLFFKKMRSNMLKQTFGKLPNPYTPGERKAMKNFFRCTKEGSSELECIEKLYLYEIDDFIALYRKAGATTIVFTDEKKGIGTVTLMEHLYALGCKWAAQCFVTRSNGVSVKGARFRL